MVEREKVVVILLLVTILLSVVSVVMTMSMDKSDDSSQKEGIKNLGPDNSVGHVAFEIVESTTGEAE